MPWAASKDVAAIVGRLWYRRGIHSAWASSSSRATCSRAGSSAVSVFSNETTVNRQPRAARPST